MKHDYAPTLGVHLLETITRGMYREPFHAVREYIQNAYDSIREARRLGILGGSDGCIRINVDPAKRTLEIRDNGAGLAPEAAAVYLLDIGKSAKGRSTEGAERNAGFRGIGRMAGMSYCRELRFETSTGDGRKCTVAFDAAGINQLTARGQEPTTIVDAIRKNSFIADESTASRDRFLAVRLIGLDAADAFLDDKALRDYIALNAPVPYDDTVWSHGDAIRAIAREQAATESLDQVQVVICDADDNVVHDVRRPFKNTFRTKDTRGNAGRTVSVEGIRALPSSTASDGGWWGWIAIHERGGALADVPFAGLRVRMHNIAIGGNELVRELFKTQYLALWVFGEIHITDLGLVPNSQRDGFEQSGSWDRIKARLREETEALEKEIRGESARRNQDPSVLIRRAETATESARQEITTGFVSDERKEATSKNLEKTADRLRAAARQRRRDTAEKEMLAEAAQAVDNVIAEVRAVRKTGTDEAHAHLNKQARRILRLVFGVLKSELSDRQFRDLQPKIYAVLRPGKAGR